MNSDQFFDQRAKSQKAQSQKYERIRDIKHVLTSFRWDDYDYDEVYASLREDPYAQDWVVDLAVQINNALTGD